MTSTTTYISATFVLFYGDSKKKKKKNIVRWYVNKERVQDDQAAAWKASNISPFGSQRPNQGIRHLLEVVRQKPRVYFLTLFPRKQFCLWLCAHEMKPPTISCFLCLNDPLLRHPAPIRPRFLYLNHWNEETFTNGASMKAFNYRCSVCEKNERKPQWPAIGRQRKVYSSLSGLILGCCISKLIGG